MRRFSIFAFGGCHQHGFYCRWDVWQKGLPESPVTSVRLVIFFEPDLEPRDVEGSRVLRENRLCAPHVGIGQPRTRRVLVGCSWSPPLSLDGGNVRRTYGQTPVSTLVLKTRLKPRTTNQMKSGWRILIYRCLTRGDCGAEVRRVAGQHICVRQTGTTHLS